MTNPYQKRVDIGGCTLYLGDSKILADAGLLKADALISDPPYGIGYQCGATSDSDPIKVIKKSRKIHGDDAPFDPMPWIKLVGRSPVLLFGADYYKTRLPEGGRFVCWDKSCGMGAAASFTDAEFMWTNRRNARCIYRQFWMGATRAGEGHSSRRKREHPTEKPVGLMAWCLDHTRVGLGKTVLDPFMGVGSTGVACIRTGRKFIGVEIDEEYFDAAVRRIQAEHDSMQDLMQA